MRKSRMNTVRVSRPLRRRPSWTLTSHTWAGPAGKYKATLKNGRGTTQGIGYGSTREIATRRAIMAARNADRKKTGSKRSRF
jgi:hypothetical protein